MASGSGQLRVTLISPEGTVYEGDAEKVVVPAWDGELGVLGGHAPLMALLGRGELRITQGRTVRRFRVEEGFLQVADDTVTVLSERAEAA